MQSPRGETFIDISLTGPVQCRAAGSWQRLDRKTAAAVVLAVTHQGYTRAHVARLLWPESSDAAAATNMRVMLHRLNKAVGATVFASTGRWSLEPQVRVDLPNLLSGPLTPDQAETALSHPILAGIDFSDLPELGELLDRARVQIADRSIKILIDHAEQLLGLGADPASALRAATIVLHHHRTNEEACRLKMRAQMLLGDRAGALSSYEACRAEIDRLLGTIPNRQTRQLHLTILRADSQPLQGLQLPSHAGTTGLRPLHTIGREPVIARLLRHMVAERHAWLIGDAGMGKSRVIEEIFLRSPSVRLFCLPNDNEHPYALIKRLIGSPASAEKVEADEDVDMASLLASSGNVPPPLDIQGVLDAVLKTLNQLHRDGVQVLIIDDLHHIDMASARVICKMCDLLTSDRGEHGLPAMLFAARPQHSNPAYLHVQRSAESGRHFEQVTLQGLDLEATREMLRELDIPSLDPQSCAERLLGMSGGNPFFMLEIVRAALETEDPGALSVKVNSIVDMLAERIGAASEAASELVALLAVATQDFHPGMATEIAHLGLVQFRAAWDELVGLGVLGTHGFAHELALSAARSRLSGLRIQQLHEGVAHFLAGRGAAAMRIAVHHLAGTRPSLSVPYVIAAAKSLWRDGLSAEAIDLADRAVDALVPHETASDIFELLWYRHYLLLSERVQERWPQSMEMMRRMASTPEQELIVDCVEMRLLIEDPHGLAKMLSIGERWSDSHRTDNRWWREIRAFHAMALVLDGKLVQAVELYDDMQTWAFLPRPALGNEDGLASWFDVALRVVASAAGRISHAAEWQARAVAEADDQALPVQQVRSRYRLSDIYQDQGRIPLALSTLREASAIAERRGMSAVIRYVLDLSMARFSIAWGQIDDAHRLLLAQPESSLIDSGVERILVAMLFAHARGDLQTAWAHHAKLQEMEITGWIDFKKYLVCLEASMLLAEKSEAAADCVERGLAFVGPDLAQMQSLLRLMQCRWLPADKALDVALALLHSSKAGGVHGNELAARTELADVNARLGRRSEAREHLDEALRLDQEATPRGITRADHAERIFQIMRSCEHPSLHQWQAQWQQWRESQSKSIETHDRPLFMRRHAWVVAMSGASQNSRNSVG